MLKVCAICKSTFEVRPYRISKAKYCSYPCYYKSKIGTHQSEQHKKSISEGIKKNLPNTIFKKKQIPWNKGIHICLNTGRTHFKKGLTPWCKEKKHTKEFKEKVSKGRKGKACGSKHPNWKGGKCIRHGHMYIYSPHHPFATKQGYMLRSRLVAEKHLKRLLNPKEITHHINRKPLDDRPKNIYVFENNSKHVSFHGYWRKNPSLQFSIKSNLILSKPVNS
jgi:hypothetical protein